MPLDDYFRVPVLEMSSASAPDMRGVYIPAPEVGLAPVGLTRQFLEDAPRYHERYSNTSYFRWLIETALGRIGAIGDAPCILDIGSGSGNSVFPCLEIFPNCRIVATDLSPNLLKILLDHAESSADARGRIVPVCMDATRDYYREGAFDMVIGAAILHHLLDPALALRAAARAVASGGHAIFFEPFENGNAILRLAYKEILRRDAAAKAAQPSSSEAPLAMPVRSFLSALVEDCDVRRGTDKPAPIYEKIDDKWLFTRSYVEAKAREAGFRHVTIYAIHDVSRPFSRQTEVNLELGLAAKPDRLPGWAWEILDCYDGAFSTELKQDLMIEGCIILDK